MTNRSMDSRELARVPRSCSRDVHVLRVRLRARQDELAESARAELFPLASAAIYCAFVRQTGRARLVVSKKNSALVSVVVGLLAGGALVLASSPRVSLRQLL